MAGIVTMLRFKKAMRRILSHRVAATIAAAWRGLLTRSVGGIGRENLYCTSDAKSLGSTAAGIALTAD